MEKPFAPSCERNREPILAVLREHFADRHNVLEIGSGTGQHAVHFAAAMPWLDWQCSDRAEALPGMRQWLDEAGLPNTPPPVELDVATDWSTLTPTLSRRWERGQKGFDAVFTANTLHIMSWPAVQALFAALPTVMAGGAVFCAYGPFNRNGEFSSDSNRDFDAWLKARGPESGIRDAGEVEALAEAAGLKLVADIAMPANNDCRVWRRVPQGQNPAPGLVR
ncbi:MAG: DUF938 domain-containing protein [Xanthomonadales bacterium]|nr:DUF938 domain-containing protein [Xanthomonadales bacterium]